MRRAHTVVAAALLMVGGVAGPSAALATQVIDGCVAAGLPGRHAVRGRDRSPTASTPSRRCRTWSSARTASRPPASRSTSPGSTRTVTTSSSPTSRSRATSSGRARSSAPTASRPTGRTGRRTRTAPGARATRSPGPSAPSRCSSAAHRSNVAVPGQPRVPPRGCRARDAADLGTSDRSLRRPRRDRLGRPGARHRCGRAARRWHVARPGPPPQRGLTVRHRTTPLDTEGVTRRTARDPLRRASGTGGARGCRAGARSVRPVGPGRSVRGRQPRRSTTWSTHAVSARTSAGSTAGNIATRSWLRPSLRYGSTSTTPCAAQHRGHRRRVHRGVEVDRPDDRRAQRRVGDERRRPRALLGPAVQVTRRTRRSGPPPSASPPWPSSQSSCSASSTSVARAGVLSVWSRREDATAVVSERNSGHPAAAGLEPRGALDRRGRAARPATGRRRTRSSSAARSSRRPSRRRRPARPPAADVASTTVSAPCLARAGHPADRRHDAGRGLVVRPGVEVDAVLELGQGHRAGLRRAHRGAPRGTAPGWWRSANFAPNSPNAACCARSLDEAERGDVPERGRAAVAEHDLVAVRQREAGPRGPHRTRPTSDRTGAWRCDVPSSVAPTAARAATCSGRTLLGPEPNRPSRGSRSLRDGEVGGAGHRPSVGPGPLTRAADRGVGRAARRRPPAPGQHVGPV